MKNDRLFDVYRAVHTQGFLPIFVKDDFQSRTLVEGCVEAGMKVIEYTLRREDAREAIPWIRKEFPDLYLIVGSTVDNDDIVRQLRSRHPQLMTLQELADLDVHGFISQMTWREASIRKWSATHVVCPHADTLNDAYLLVTAGAHLVKMIGPDRTALRKARSAPTFGFCPVLITGGQLLEQIPDTIAAGAVMVATGFDFTLKGVDPEDLTVARVRDTMKRYVEVTNEARTAALPELIGNRDADRETWLASLPHFHPF